MGIALLSEAGPSGSLRRFGRAFFFYDIFQGVTRVLFPSYWRNLWHMTTEYSDIVEGARSLIAHQQKVIRHQQDGLYEAQRIINALEERNMSLLYEMNTLAEAALILRSDPDADLGDDIEAVLESVRDQLAVFEEHTP